MAVFSYKALGAGAALVRGAVTADTARQARDVLRDQGLTITEIAPVQQGSKVTFRQPRAGRRDQVELVAFVRELATLLTAGIPLLSALHTLAGQHRRRLQAVIQHLAGRVAAGESLAEAMGREPAYFDELAVSVVRVGESTGSLETALKRLADFKEKAMRFRSRVTAALTYPTIVCIMGVAVAAFLMTYVVPSLLNTLVQAGKPLPAITRVVKAASDFLVTWWWALLGAIGLAVLAVKAALRSEWGRELADRVILRLPVVGELVRKENTSQIAVVLAALLRSGLQFVGAIRIVRRTIRNRLFRRSLDEYEAAVTAGSDVAGPLAASGVFSPMVVQMLAVGQESGRLEDMLEQLAEAYDQEVSTATVRLMALLEPLLIVALAVLVGFIAFATVLPILEVSNVL